MINNFLQLLLEMQKSNEGKLSLTNDVYEVQKILQRGKSKGQIYYLVQWKGFDEEYATWEPLSNLKNCQKAIKEFENIISKIEKQKDLEKSQKSTKHNKKTQNQEFDKSQSPQKINKIIIEKNVTQQKQSKVETDKKDQVKKIDEQSEKVKRLTQQFHQKIDQSSNSLQELTTAQMVPFQKEKINEEKQKSIKFNLRSSKILKPLKEIQSVSIKNELKRFTEGEQSLNDSKSGRKKVKKDLIVQSIDLKIIKKNCDSKQKKEGEKDESNYSIPKNEEATFQTRKKLCNEYLTDYKQDLIFHLTRKIINPDYDPILSNKFIQISDESQILTKRQSIKIFTSKQIQHLHHSNQLNDYDLVLLVKTKQPEWYSLLRNEKEKDCILARVDDLPEDYWKSSFEKFITKAKC